MIPGLEIDPSNQQMTESLSDSERSKSAGEGSALFGPEFTARLAMNPKTRGYLSQPDFMAMLRDMSANPQNMSNYMQDPRLKVQ